MPSWIRPAFAIVLTVVAVAVGVAGRVVAGGQPPVTLTILAGSELADVLSDADIVASLRDRTGVNLEVTYSGTLEGADRLVSGERFDLAWFSSDHYLRLLLRDRNLPDVAASEPVLRSPVVLGVKRSRAADLGWITVPPSWSTIAEEAGRGNLQFAMTNPASSNSGLSTLVSVAAAFDPNHGPLQAEDIDDARLTAFFSGQTQTAATSKPLANTFLREQDQLDAIVTYESELLALNANPAIREPLELIYPQDGAVYANYPLIQVSRDNSDTYRRMLDWLRDSGTQKLLSTATKRRPIDATVEADATIPNRTVPELALPADLTTAEQLIFAYLDVYRRPARTLYVVDVSTSMGGQRINDLRRAFADLTGNDRSISGQFARFRKNELITIIPFSGTVRQALDVAVRDPQRDSQELTGLRDHVERLELAGGTAIYDALAAAYDRVRRDVAANENYYTSIVLMTDGEVNSGTDFAQFKAHYEQSGLSQLGTRTFVVKFGEANEPELRQLADLTRGELFDATTSSLRKAFQEIRGYQ